MTHDSHSDALLPAEANRRMFDSIAERYDRLNHVLSLGLDRHWRRQAVRALQLTDQATVLDAGCGTGDLCLDILLSFPAARTIGIDPSEGMLMLARKKLHRSKCSSRSTFTTGDVTALTCEDDFFDGVISAFCIRNVCHRQAAFREIHRVLKPGSRVALLELTRPENALLRGGHCFFLRYIVPLLGALLSRGDAYHYLADSIQQFAKPQIVLDEMREAGLLDVQAQPLTGGIVTLFSGKA
ncbi:MAG: ubiquinone/menaquinone biosynthesis methyltransferase [Kiritimatiellae bacterium]|nr:ubiquinone/menaquinone biosynthesis methyltransferase [Kiritimatiellia bacterium]